MPIRPITVTDPDLRVRATTELVMGCAVGVTPPEAPIDPVHLEALGFRRLGEQAQASGNIDAAIGHYERAVNLWRDVGCRRALAKLKQWHALESVTNPAVPSTPSPLRLTLILEQQKPPKPKRQP